MGFRADLKQVGFVGALRRSRASMVYTGLQEVGRMVRHPKIYFSSIQPHPSKTALIVVDGINGFLHPQARLGMKGVESIFGRMNKTIEAARKEGIPIFYLCDGHLVSDAELQQWPDHARRRTWESQVDQRISQPIRRQEWVFKNAFSAFAAIEKIALPDAMRGNQVLLGKFFANPAADRLLLKGGLEELREIAGQEIADATLREQFMTALKPATHKKPNLQQQLKALDIKRLYVLGVATEYCDEANSTDGVDLGYDVTVISDSIREVDLKPGDGERAIHRMVRKGVKFLDTFKVIDRIERREYATPFQVEPTDFKVGPSVVENARPIVTEDIAGRQAEFTASVNFRKDPFPAWLTQTDMYQLVMANLFFQSCRGNTPVAHFEAFVRKYPTGRDFMILSGLRDFLHWMKNVRMDEDRIKFFMSQPIIRESVSDLPAFADYLRNFKFKLDVWSYPEGTFYAPTAPFIGISGPIEQVLLAETYLLSMINSRSAFSTRAAQYRLANPDIATLAMEMRRMDAQLSEVASFEGFLQGFVGTSNVEAAYQYGIKPAGTNSHAMYLAFNREIEAIRKWMEIYPHHPMVLTDTFHVLINALKTGAVLQEKGMRSTSSRTDSGRLAKLMGLHQRVLADKGFGSDGRFATNDLTPLLLAEMAEQLANANAVGVGTKFGEVPATPAVLKLSEIDGPDGSRYICKLSTPEKASLPGIHQVWRRYDADGHAVGDVIALLDERVEGAGPLMVPFTSGGYLLQPYPNREGLQAQYAAGRASLPRQIIDGRGLGTSGFKYPVTYTERAGALREKVFADIRAREIDPYLAELARYATPPEIAEAMGD